MAFIFLILETENNLFKQHLHWNSSIQYFIKIESAWPYI